MSMAICLYVRDAQLRSIPVGAEVPEEMMNIYRSEVYDEIKQEIMRDAPEKMVK
jgi:sRNA-binding carbon storage regulator CsrA